MRLATPFVCATSTLSAARQSTKQGTRFSTAEQLLRILHSPNPAHPGQ